MFELFSSLYFIMEGAKMTSEGRSLQAINCFVLLLLDPYRL